MKDVDNKLLNALNVVLAALENSDCLPNKNPGLDHDYYSEDCNCLQCDAARMARQTYLFRRAMLTRRQRIEFPSTYLLTTHEAWRLIEVFCQQNKCPETTRRAYLDMAADDLPYVCVAGGRLAFGIRHGVDGGDYNSFGFDDETRADLAEDLGLEIVDGVFVRNAAKL